jgi:hypothetical protein
MRRRIRVVGAAALASALLGVWFRPLRFSHRGLIGGMPVVA